MDDKRLSFDNLALAERLTYLLYLCNLELAIMSKLPWSRAKANIKDDMQKTNVVSGKVPIDLSVFHEQKDAAV
jgi:hypothetical protein